MKRASITLTFLILFTLSSFQAFAAAPAHPAGKLIDTAVTEVLKRLSSPDIHKAGPVQDKLLKEVEELIYARLDFEEFSARTIGAKWRTLSDTERKEFQQAISDLLYYTYFKSLLSYKGEPVEYVGEIVSSKGDKVEVKTNFMYEGKPIPINYRMLNKNGTWLVYDIFIESISIVQNYRGQFQQVLQKETPQELTKMIRAKADETKAAADAAIASPKL